MCFRVLLSPSSRGDLNEQATYRVLREKKEREKANKQKKREKEEKRNL